MLAGLRRFVPPAYEAADGIERVRMIEHGQPNGRDAVGEILPQTLHRRRPVVHRDAVARVARNRLDVFGFRPTLQRRVEVPDVLRRTVLAGDRTERLVDDAAHVAL